MKKFLAEFKAFALRGNVIDMAVGIIIGGAFSGIVTALIDNFINPLIQFITRQASFTGADVATFATNFVSAVINFVIMAFILFCLIRFINKLISGKKKEEAPAEPTTKVCPYCKSEIAIEATRCAHCTSELN